MKRTIVSLLLAAVVGCSTSDGAPTGARRRIVDVHLHAFHTVPGMIDASVGLGELKFPAPATDEDLRDESLAALRASGVVKAVVSGTADLVDRWVTDDPELLIPGLMIGNPPAGEPLDALAPDVIRQRVRSGATMVLGEMAQQYHGLSPSDPAVAEYLALAEELEIPVHIHTAGVGAWTPGFRSAAGSPLLLEPVLTRHPNLRMYVENAGYPFLDDMLAMLFQYPERLYVDVSTVIRIVPRAEFYRYLRTIIEAGYADRIMFGSDQVYWPQTIQTSIATIEEAPFLSEEQKEAIFYGNAVRFFGLKEGM